MSIIFFFDIDPVVWDFFFPFQLWSDSHTRWWWWWSSKSSSSSWMIILQFEICYHCFSLWMLSKRNECIHANKASWSSSTSLYLFILVAICHLTRHTSRYNQKEKKTENDQTSNVHSTVRSDHFIFFSSLMMISIFDEKKNIKLWKSIAQQVYHHRQSQPDITTDI